MPQNRNSRYAVDPGTRITHDGSEWALLPGQPNRMAPVLIRDVFMAKQKTVMVVTRAADGSLRTKTYDNFDKLHESYEQIGIDDCSTDLTLRGLPFFRGLVGPLTESKTIARYESPEVFEFLTKQWAKIKTKRRRRKKHQGQENAIPTPNLNLNVNTPTQIPAEF
ncbi:MAG: hypothetical protein AAF623_07230 [Planctomycetota bacterium]